MVARERDTRMVCAVQVPRKGTTGSFAKNKMMAFVRELGYEYSPIILKSDGEAAVKAVIDEVALARGGTRTIKEEAPKGSSGSNGIAERAILSVEQQMRAMKSALEDRWKVEIPDAHAVVAWLVEYSAVLLNRCEVGKDGKTAYERSRGKTAKVNGIEFGEKVLFRKSPIGNRLAKFSSLWDDGVYLGVRSVSAEMIVGTEKGIWRTRTVQRRPFSERWSAENANLVGGAPWNLSKDDPEADGVMDKVVMGERVPEEEHEKIREEVAQALPRSFLIKMADLDEHGFTSGCSGCRAIIAGRGRQHHSTECRRRLEDAMKNREKVKEAKWRENEFIAKAVEKDNMEKKRARAGDGDGNASSSADGGRPGGATEASGSGAEKTEGETKRSRLRSGSRAGEEDQEPDQAGMEGVEADFGPREASKDR